MEKVIIKIKNNEILRPSILAIGLFFMVTIISPKINILLPATGIAILFDYLILKENIVIRKQHILICIFMIIVLLSMIIASEKYSLVAIPPYIIFSLMFLLFTTKEYTRKQINFISRCIEIGGIITSVLIIFFGKTYYGEELRYTIILNGERQDPNFTAVLLCLPMILFLFRVIYGKTLKFKLFSAVGVVITIFTIVLTGSRTGMICISAIVLISIGIRVILNKNKIKFNSKKAIGIILIAILIGLIGLNLLPDQITDRIFNYSNTYKYDNSAIIAGSPRLNIWINAMDLVFQHPIIGYGLGMSDYYMPLHKGLITALHNTYIDVWFQFGILGLVAFIVIIASFIYDSIKTKSYYLLNIVVIIIIAAGFLDLFYGREVWIILSFMMIALNYVCLNKVSIHKVLGE